MHRIVLPDLVRLLARVGTRRIGDPAVPVVLAEAGVERGVAVRDGALRADADAEASVALHVFNETGDRDSGGVLGTRRRRAGALAAGDHRPLLLKTDHHAWLRVALAVSADARVRGSGRSFDAGASANGQATLLAYRRHAPDEDCAAAIVDDLARFADARSVGDVCTLGVGDACVMQAEGTLTASVSLSWAALLSATVPAAAELAGRDAQAWLVEVPAEGGAELAVSIADGFSVSFARLHSDGDAAFRVALRRHHRDERSLAASLSVDAGFADPAAVAHVATGALAAVLAVPADALRAIREATSLRALPARHRPYVAALVERLGLADNAPLEALRERLETLDARLAGRIEAVVRARASVVVEAEYRRLAQDTLLLEAELSEAALRRLHPALLALDTATILADDGPGRAAWSLLHDRSIERLQGWSIGAALGSWFELEGRQRRQDRFLERRRVDAGGDTTRHEYAGATRYTARANGWSTAYGATLEAVDDGTGPSCALHLWWEEGRLRADAGGLARIVDDAVLWGLVTADGAAALHARLLAGTEGIGRCRPRFDIVLEAGAASAALARLASANRAEWATHMARALPRNAWFPARADCAARGSIYGPVFALLGDTSGPGLRRAVAGALRAEDRRLVARERTGQAPWTAWRVLQQSGLTDAGPARSWRAWGEAAARCTAALDGGQRTTGAGAAVTAIGDAFGDLRAAFEQPFPLRTVASLLAGPAHAGGGVSLALAFERDGEARSLLVGA